GAIHCVESVSTFGGLAARALKPGAALVIVPMGRLYPLETAVFLLKGNPRRALVRLKRQPVVGLEGIPVSCWYHSPRNLRHALGAEFSLQQLRGWRSFALSPSLERIGRFLPLALIRALDG